jgi:hypothetical protein
MRRILIRRESKALRVTVETREIMRRCFLCREKEKA